MQILISRSLDYLYFLYILSGYFFVFHHNFRNYLNFDDMSLNWQKKKIAVNLSSVWKLILQVQVEVYKQMVESVCDCGGEWICENRKHYVCMFDNIFINYISIRDGIIIQLWRIRWYNEISINPTNSASNQSVQMGFRFTFKYG